MKQFLLCSFLLIAINSYSQNYTFNRIYILDEGSLKGLGGFTKMKGEVSVTDTTMVIITEGTHSIFKVITTLKKDGFQQFRAVSDTQTDWDIRVTLQSISSPQRGDPQKKETHTLFVEMKDNFTNVLTKMMYYLIPKSD